MTTLFVTYPATEGARFDRDYYVSTHLPLAEKLWGPSGLTSARGYFPADADAGTVAIALLEFRDEAALAAALASDAAAQVMADVPNYTDITPVVSKGVAP